MRVRSLLLLLIVAPAVAGPGDDDVVRNEELNFEISMPPNSIDWDKVALPEDKSKAHLKAHFSTEYADTNPRSEAAVQLIVVPLTKMWARKKLMGIAMQWQDQMEDVLTEKREIKQGDRKLAGQPSYFRDLKGNFIAGVGHVTWDVTRMGNYLYVFYVRRTYRAVNDEDLEEEIASIRKSFKFLKEIKVKAHKKAGKGKVLPVAGGGADVEEVDPEKVKRENLELSHWRIKCVKPEGLFNIDPKEFGKGEKASNVVAKFERRRTQIYLMIRIYAQSAKSQRFTISQLAKSKLAHFEKTYKKHRLDPEEDYKYKKFPLAKSAIRLKLVGRRTVPETTIWLLAQCKNDRQYQIEIYATGAAGEKAWKPQLDDFLKNFKPVKK